MKLYNILIFILLVFILSPVMATSTSMVWSKSLGSPVNNIDTSESGNIVVAGLNNGSIISYDQVGNYKWQYNTNGSIEKIRANGDGDIVWYNTLNESGYIDSGGVSHFYKNDSMRNITGIDISSDGLFVTIVEKYPPRIRIFSKDGDLIQQNLTYKLANWTGLAYDPYNTWIATSNESSNKLVLWNISNYTGWLEFNPTLDFKNSSLRFIDTFPYRQNISIASYTNTTRLTFHNTSNTTFIQQINESYYEYNMLNTGKYFYWATPRNYTEPSTIYLNTSRYNSSTDDLIIDTKPNWKNFTIYYGNLSHYMDFQSSDGVNLTFIINSTQNWTAVNAYTIRDVEIVGGGGAGGGSPYGGASWYTAGMGGSAGQVLKYASINIIPGNVYPFVVPTHAPGVSGGVGYTGGCVSAFNYTATGGVGGAKGTGPYGIETAPVNGEDGYSTSSTIPGDGWGGGLTYLWVPPCTQAGRWSGSPGTGRGAGGGGASDSGAGGVCQYDGTGGRGSIGVVKFNLTNSVYYDNGTLPTASFMSNKENSQNLFDFSFVSSKSFSGCITAMSVPEKGGWIGLSTSQPMIYHQQISGPPVAFGSEYSGSANFGDALSISTADGASFSMEGRGLYGDIYLIDGTRKGTYTTGGTLRSVDIAMVNGLWTTAGGDDGKLYIFSKDATSAWYVFYQGDSGFPILSTAMSWRGEYTALGRSDGLLEYYTTGSNTSGTSTYMVNVFVRKGGSAYSTNISVTGGAASVSGSTDSYGKYSFSAIDLTNYVINVNGGEYIFNYQATSSYTTITINIPVALMTRPYVYAASYDDVTNIITTTYTDVNNADVNITVTDMINNTVIHMADYLATTTVTDTVLGDPTHEYRINLRFTRTTGTVYQDTLYVKTSIFGKITHTPDQWKLFEYGVYCLFLMFVALGIGTTSPKYGVILIPALVVLGVIIGFLPASIWLVPLVLSVFIAMTEVMRRRPD